MKCPHCGSENVNLISNVTSRGFSASNACCGTLLTGNCIGMLCGFCGSGKTKNKEFWVCNNCGSKFQDSEIKRYNQNLNYDTSYENESEEAYQGGYALPGYTQEKTSAEETVKHSEPKTRIEKPSAYNGNLTADALLKRARIFI